MESKQDASVTVFAAMAFLILLSLMLTLLESARQSACRAYLSGLTGAALESLFADYYAPLYEEYHIFGLNMQCGAYAGNDAMPSGVMSEYINYSLGDEDGERTMGLWGACLVDNSVYNMETLTDNGCNAFINEAVSYEKLNAAGSLAESLLEYAGVLKKNKEACKLIEKKLEAEERLAVLDEDVVRLMTRIDGITFDKSGVTYDRQGRIATEDYFVKQLSSTMPGMSAVRMNHSELYEAVRGRYVYINPLLKRIEAAGLSCAEAVAYRSSMGLAVAILENEMARLRESSREDKVSELENLTSQTEAARLAYAEAERRLRECTDTYMAAVRELSGVHSGTSRAVDEALIIISEIEKKQPSLQKTVLGLETALLEAAGGSEEPPDGLLDELGSTVDQMKGYVGLDGSGMTSLNIQEMKTTLLKNRGVLDEAEKLVQTIYAADQYEAAGKIVGQLQAIYSGYSFDGLSFDYSKMSLKTAEDLVSDAVEKFAANGILSLLFENSEGLSDGQVISSDLISAGYGEQEGASEGILTQKKGSSTLKEAMDDEIWGVLSYVSEKLLLAGYMQNHFTDVINVETAKGERTGDSSEQSYDGHVLGYEQEYILCGGSGDRINLERISLRLLLLRFVGSLIYCLTNRSITQQAAAFAASVVGFTGLPFVVSLVKYIVLIVWAVVQALVEVSAIINGKRIAFMTNKELFCVELNEIPLMNGKKITDKADKLSEQDFFPDYKVYMLIFLVFQDTKTQAARAADLIQENLREKYEHSFNMNSCVYSASSLTTYETSCLFAGALPNKHILYRVEKYISY